MLARGTRLREVPAHVFTRFIPACTGNSWRILLYSRIIAVHPRVYGELGGRGRDGRRGQRFIPACTGNSKLLCAVPFCRTVHPRVYGELSRSMASAFLCSGSSPRVRGTHGVICGAVVERRFIPACTGNSRGVGGVYGWRSVHPRVYGEL